MTRQSHDQLAKQYLTELLTPLGQVETSFDIASEVRQVDVWFLPTSPLSTDVLNLGLLGRIASNSCMLEVFLDTPPTEVRGILPDSHPIYPRRTNPTALLGSQAPAFYSREWRDVSF